MLGVSEKSVALLRMAGPGVRRRQHRAQADQGTQNRLAHVHLPESSVHGFTRVGGDEMAVLSAGIASRPARTWAVIWNVTLPTAASSLENV